MLIYLSPSSDNMSIFNKLLFAFLLVLVVGFVYLTTMPPTIYWGDGIELTTAAYFLGIPHPTGYPLYMLLGKLFSFIPVADVGWRLNFASSIFSLCASLVLFFLFRLISKRLFPARFFPSETYCNSLAFIFALSFSFSRTIWRLSIIAEVYSLYLLFLTGIIYLAFLYYFTTNTRYLFLLSFLFLLSLTHHTLTLTALPFLLIAFLKLLFFNSDKTEVKRKVSFILLTIILSLPALFDLAYLPIRARVHPPIVWGFPANFHNFLWVISGGDFKDTYFLNFPARNPLTAETLFPYLVMRLTTLYHWLNSDFFDLSTTGFKARGLYLLAFLFLWGAGLIFLLFQRTLLALSLFGNILLVLLIIFLYGIYDIEDYFVAFLPALVIFIFVGFTFVQNLLEHLLFQRKLRYVNWLLLGLPLFIFLSHFHNNNLRQDFSPETYARRLFDCLPQDAIVITGGDNDIYPLWYLQLVKGHRPDVLIFGGNFIYSGWYKEFFYHTDLRGRKIYIEERPISTEEQYLADLAQWIIKPNIASFPLFTTSTTLLFEQFYTLKPVATLIYPAEIKHTIAKYLPPPFLFSITHKR